MNEKKMTYAQALEIVIKNEELPQEVKERLTDLRISLQKRNSKISEKNLAEKQAFEKEILRALNSYEKVQIKTLVNEHFSTYSTQKLTPYLKALSEKGLVDRMDKVKTRDEKNKSTTATMYAINANGKALIGA